MKFNNQRALELLRLSTQNPPAQFREGQADAIQHVIEGRGRLLVVQKTGWGKSLVYFIAAKLLRESGSGPALLISPLLALMRNQIEAARFMGLRAETIHSDNQADWTKVQGAVARDEVDLLLISPERLANETFVSQVWSRISTSVVLLVIDEAHCISDWGHDFRPHYRLIQRMVANLPRNLRLLATTATANNRVMDDLSQILGPGLTVMRGDLNRPSLFLQTIRLPSPAERLAWLSENLPRMPGSGIIYTLTVRDADRVSTWLQHEGFSVDSYTSESGEKREELEHALLQNKVKALIATTALGMGFDKPDLGFVIHYQAPGSVVAYYQQVGRAGRALSKAYGVLLSGSEEMDITDYFIESAFPTHDEVQELVYALQMNRRGLTTSELLREVNISKGRVDKTLQLLALESPSPVMKEGNKWVLTTAVLSHQFWKRTQRLTDLRRQEQRQMQEYVRLKEGHMGFLIRALDGDVSNIETADLPALPAVPDQIAVRRALEFLHRNEIVIKPRRQWPAGGLPKMRVRGRIPPEYQISEGRCLCLWGDPGWGGLVRAGKFRSQVFADDLVEGLAGLIHRWNPNPFPTWLTFVPSNRHPSLVSSLASRLAERLGLPLISAIRNVSEHPPQKTMHNSAMQAANVDGAFAIIPGTCQNGAVFLIDDMIDSAWTMTVAGYLLRQHGSGPVYPLALALTGNR
jgi:ATP-dependent DNA helicase RecQ